MSNETKLPENNPSNDIPEVVDNDIPQVKEPFSLPKVIKTVKQASNQLLEKINKIDFKQKKNQVLEWLKEHKKAAIIGAATLATAATAMLGAAINNSQNNVNNENAQPDLNKDPIENVQEDVNSINTLNEAPKPIDYTSLNIDTTVSQSKLLNRDEAEALINNGQEVVASFDNTGTPIGYVAVEPQTINNESGITK